MRNAVRLLSFIILILLAPAVPRSAPVPQAQAQGPTIRLVLLVAVDQFRYDYLTRFRGEYTSGFKQLLTDGAVFTNANLEHYPTVTAVGHSTMLTGATPSVSGIIGNDWFDRESGKSVASITDETVKPVGASGAATASPRRLLVGTLGDEMKLASGPPHPATLLLLPLGLAEEIWPGVVDHQAHRLCGMTLGRRRAKPRLRRFNVVSSGTVVSARAA